MEGPGPGPDLTPREKEVLELVDRGLTNEEIAERLGISLSTTKHHVSEILSKAGVASRHEAAPALGRNWLGMAWRMGLGVSAMAVLAGVVVLGVAVLAGSDNDDEGDVVLPELRSPTGSAPPTVSRTPRPTPQFDQAQVEAVLTLPGFVGFMTEFMAALKENDVQFLIDRASFADYQCTGIGGMPAPPDNCEGRPIGTTTQAMLVGRWNSEGSIYSPGQYADAMRRAFDGVTAGSVELYALGQLDYSDEFQSDEVDVVVSGLNVGSFVEGIEPALSFGLANSPDGWRITELHYAVLGQVPDFFQWWAPWNAAFPAGESS